VNINKQAVEEVAIATGGFDAEYGEALSGVVNVVTREGGEKFGGSFRYSTDEIFSGKKLNYGYNLYELSLGGSLLQKTRFRYFLSGEAMLTDAYEPAYYHVPSERFDYKLDGKLSYRLPKAKGKVIMSAFMSREQYMNYADIWGNLGFIHNLENNFGIKRKNKLATLTANYMLNEHSIIESKFGYTEYSRLQAVRDMEQEEEENRQWYEDYIFKAEHIIDDLKIVGDDTIKKQYLIDTLMNYYVEMSRSSSESLRNNPYGATGIFYTYGDQRLWRYEYNHDYQAILSMTNSIGQTHEVKTGLTVIQSKILWYDNNLPFYTNPFWDLYEKEPLRIAGYVQDRMDFEGIIARIGLRLDYFDSKAAGLANPSDRADSTEIEASPKYRVSPRIGFSMPITDRSKFRFNYGHFFQTPRANDLYRATEPMVIWAQRQNNVLGNPDLTVEKTVAYEIGYENQFTDVFAFGFIAYYKDIYDLVQTRRVVSLPYPYYQVTNVDYGNVKGIEITLKKRMHQYWSMDFSYTLQFAKGTASDAWQHYYDVYMDEDYDLPRIDYWLDFDERHIVNASIGMHFPNDFRIMPLKDFLTNVVFSYHSGFPYTPEDSKGQPLGDQNSARLPGYVNVDMNIAKEIKFQGFAFLVFANMYNLLNTEQIVQVYAATGLPSDDGGAVKTDETDFVTIPMTSAYYTPQADYNHDGLNAPSELLNEYLNARSAYYNNPFHWNPGFRMRVGIGLKI
jgi:outer membrane receptor protein involved in Fe transport